MHIMFGYDIKKRHMKFLLFILLSKWTSLGIPGTQGHCVKSVFVFLFLFLDIN